MLVLRKKAHNFSCYPLQPLVFAVPTFVMFVFFLAKRNKTDFCQSLLAFSLALGLNGVITNIIKLVVGMESVDIWFIWYMRLLIYCFKSLKSLIPHTHPLSFQADHVQTSSTDASQRGMWTLTTFLISAQLVLVKQMPFRKDARASQADMLLVRIECLRDFFLFFCMYVCIYACYFDMM